MYNYSNNFSDPTDFLLFTNVDTGEVGMANADLMGGRTMIIRAMNPIAITYDPANQVSGRGKCRFNGRSHNDHKGHEPYSSNIWPSQSGEWVWQMQI